MGIFFLRDVDDTMRIKSLPPLEESILPKASDYD
jgi:hypothetical protein